MSTAVAKRISQPLLSLRSEQELFRVEKGRNAKENEEKERKPLWLTDYGRVLRDTHPAANHLADVTSFKKLDKTLDTKYAIKG